MVQPFTGMRASKSGLSERLSKGLHLSHLMTANDKVLNLTKIPPGVQSINRHKALYATRGAEAGA
jgi:hypothetical protein